MELSYHRINMASCRERRQSFVDIVSRGHVNEVWHVLFKPMDFKTEPDWRFYRREQQVAIPLFPYMVNADPVDALGFAFQLGVRALHDLGGRPCRRLHLSLGDPLDQVDDGSEQLKWTFYLGFGIVLE